MPATAIDDRVLNDAAPPAKVAEAPQKGTYGQILKSSALVGGSSFLNIGIGIFRTKAMAMLLGPGGFGLFGLYGSVLNLTQTLAGMGINSSGVREIAEANVSDDADRVAQTTLVLRRISLLLGLIGATILVVFSRPISKVTFGSYQNSGAVALLSIGVFFNLVSAGQGALIQGMRRIADLAKMGIFGTLFGTIISVSMVYFFREKGIVPALVAIAVMMTLVSWWYSRRIRIKTTSLSFATLAGQSAAFLKLGFAFMSSSLMTVGVAYVVRIAILHKFGAEATGIYQSAWTLGGLYVGFILQAMGADFYPRLTASANDNQVCNRLVNEQAQVGLLIAGPGVIATLTIAPLIISLFYTAKFLAAVGLLRWICLGTILQVITWPMGFIIVAKAKRALFIGCELAWSVFSLGLAWACMSYFGLSGAGIAFFGSYIFHGFLIYAVVSRLSGFAWSAGNVRSILIFTAIISIAFGGFYVLPLTWAYAAGVLALIVGCAYSLRTLLHLLPLQRIPPPVMKVLGLLRLAPSVG